jgi:hypothetical protein
LSRPVCGREALKEVRGETLGDPGDEQREGIAAAEGSARPAIERWNDDNARPCCVDVEADGQRARRTSRRLRK